MKCNNLELLGLIIARDAETVLQASMVEGDLHFKYAFSCSTKEPGSSDIFVNFYPRSSIESVRASVTIVHIRKLYEFFKISFDSASF